MTVAGVKKLGQRYYKILVDNISIMVRFSDANVLFRNCVPRNRGALTPGGLASTRKNNKIDQNTAYM